MRIRKDVKEGDLIFKNRGGWYVPLKVSSQPIGEVVSIYKDKKINPFGIVRNVNTFSEIEKDTIAFNRAWAESKERAFRELFEGAFK